MNEQDENEKKQHHHVVAFGETRPLRSTTRLSGDVASSRMNSQEPHQAGDLFWSPKPSYITYIYMVMIRITIPTQIYRR